MADRETGERAETEAGGSADAGSAAEPGATGTAPTTELTQHESRAGQTALALEELRAHLPGLEPDRKVTDWGRSERVESVVDRTLYEFLYHYWFRVSVEGMENVPGEGPVLMVANHGGALPASAAMIVKAIRQEHPLPRPVHFVTAPEVTDLPAVGMLVTKVGGVSNHRANLHRLLFDEQQLVLAFPEAQGAPAKALKHRYRLRPFGEGEAIEAALDAGASIVPVAMVGTEEALPVIGQIRLLSRLTGLPRLRLGSALPLPAKMRIRFLEPVNTEQFRRGDSDRTSWNGGLVSALAQDIRALIQENLLEMLAQRRSVWLG